MPDVVLPKYHTIVLVHECFWHQLRMQGRPGFRNKQGFWADKFEKISGATRLKNSSSKLCAGTYGSVNFSNKEKREAQPSALAEEIKEYHRF